jgi:Lar family restriction alleviation protein
MSIEPDPCPFCGSKRLEIRYSYRNSHVVCKCCGACGGFYESEKAAIESWNNRESNNPEIETNSQKKTPYSEMAEMISAIAKTLEEIREQEKLIAAKILKEEKEGRD